MNINKKTIQVVQCGLFAALTCIATMIIRIPTTKGYVHIGDCLVILSAILLGPLAGAISAGIGSMFADILGGYYVFSGATLIIKFLAALSAGLMFRLLQKKSGHHLFVSSLSAGITSELIVVAGYFVFEIFYEGFAIALLEILPNTVQGIVGIVLAVLLAPILLKLYNRTNN